MESFGFHPTHPLIPDHAAPLTMEHVISDPITMVDKTELLREYIYKHQS